MWEEILRETNILKEPKIAELEKEQGWEFKERFDSLEEFKGSEEFKRVKEFKKSEEFQNERMKGSLDCNISNFLFNFDFDLSHILTELPSCEFSLCTFAGKFYSTDQEIKPKIHFYSVTFLDNVFFFNNTVEVSAVFLNTTFSQIAHFFANYFSKGADFKKTKFNFGANFSSTIFNEFADFSNAQFEGKIEFRNTHFKQKTFFNGDPEADQEANSFTPDFSGAKFIKKAEFLDRRFEDGSSFRNTHFEGVTDFSHSQFLAKVDFTKTHFGSTIVFENVHFLNPIHFDDTTIAKNMVLRDALFKQGVDFSYTNFIESGTLQNFELNLDLEAMQNIPASNRRKTFRMLKHHSLKENDRLNALKYYEQEMKAHRKELKKAGKRWGDWFLLCISAHTNNYDLGWFRSILWLLGVGGGLFGWYYYSLETQPISFTTNTDWKFSSFVQVAGYFLQFMNPTHSINFIEETKLGTATLSSCSLFIDMIARVFISFLYYQTIQAMRKYSRNL